MQFTTDLTRTEIKAAEVAEKFRLGAARSGLRGLGIRNSLPDLERLPFLLTRFLPP